MLRHYYFLAGWGGTGIVLNQCPTWFVDCVVFPFKEGEDRRKLAAPLRRALTLSARTISANGAAFFTGIHIDGRASRR